MLGLPLFRFYLVSDSGLYRLPQRALAKEASFPRLAGTIQRTIQAQYSWKAKRLLLDCRGFYAAFDESGLFGHSNEQIGRAFESNEIATLERLRRLSEPNVISAGAVRRTRQIKAESEWVPSEADVRAVTNDLLGPQRPRKTRAVPILKA